MFLLDVSGSMSAPNKLPLLKSSLKMLVEHLGANDRVAIVVYAGAAGLVLPSTSLDEKQKILDALDQLQSGGSTNGGEGIQLAYKIAKKHFIKGGINRVILATDGDFNVGTSSQGELVRLVQDKAKSGVFLSILGFGQGNLNDSTMEEISNKGNGNYSYIDSMLEAKKVLVKEMGGTLVTIAKDVKIQMEFNPKKVQAWRLIGYENRLLNHSDFNDDKKDAGEIGSSHSVTALYEIVPHGIPFKKAPIDSLKYQQNTKSSSDDLFTVKLRYKEPNAQKSSRVEYEVKDTPKGEASEDFQFAASVASFGMLLRDSPHKGESHHNLILDLAEKGLGEDREGYRAEFMRLVKKHRDLTNP